MRASRAAGGLIFHWVNGRACMQTREGQRGGGVGKNRLFRFDFSTYVLQALQARPRSLPMVALRAVGDARG